MIDASDPSQSTSLSPSGKIEDASLRRTVSQTVTDTCNPVPSPHIANPMSPNRSTNLGPCKHCRESEAHQKRERSEYNILEAVVQGLPRSDLLDRLETHCKALVVGGIYMMPPDQVFTWTLEGSSEQARQLQLHLILRHMEIEDNLHQWRRSIAEKGNLGGHNTFFTEAQANQRAGKHTRRSGERTSSKAHMEYLAH